MELKKLIKQAKSGDLNAQFNLGIAYYKGEGIDQDTGQAVHWFRLAAEQGDGREMPRSYAAPARKRKTGKREGPLSD